MSKFFVFEFDESDPEYDGKFGVLHDAECATGCERALMIDAFETEAEADTLVAALNNAYDAVDPKPWSPDEDEDEEVEDDNE